MGRAIGPVVSQLTIVFLVGANVLTYIREAVPIRLGPSRSLLRLKDLAVQESCPLRL